MCVFLTSSVSVFAQTNLTWDPNGAAAGTGGAGTWNTTNARWFNGTAHVPWSNVTFDNATFDGTAGTVTLGVNVNVHNITFVSSGYTIATRTITLGGVSPTITTAGATATISSVLAGTAGLTTAGAGSLTLSGNNTYSGGTTISAGTLRVGSGGTSGTLGSGNVVNDAALVINRSNAVTFGQAISGTGTLTKLGAGTTTLTGANTYSGTTTISAGTIQVGSGGTAGSLGTGSVTNNAGLSFNRSDAITVANDISGTGTLRNIGAGTTTLTGSNTYSGTTTISAGTLQVGDGGTSGTLGTGAVSNSGVLDVRRSDALTIGQVISGTGSFRQTGTGTTTLTGNNTFSGGTIISAGTLQVGNGGTTGALGAGAITNNAALVINRSNAVTFGQAISGTGTLTKLGAGTTTLTGNNSYSGTTTISAGVLQVGSGGTAGSLGSGNVTNNAGLTFNRSNALTVGNDISGTGNVTKLGSGTTTLTGSNTYSGTTLISAGTLQIGGGGTVGTIGSGAISNNAALRINRSDAFTLDQTISGSGSLTQFGSGTTTLTGNNTYSGVTTISSGTLQVGIGGTSGTLGTGNITNNSVLDINRSDAYTISRVMSGTGSFVHSGAGTTTLTAANTYSGPTVINAGTLQIGSGGTAGTLGSGAVTNNANLLFNRSNNLTVANAIGGTGSLAKSGAGTLTLTGVNTYTGTTTINAGTVRVNGSLGNTATTVASGATLGGSGTIAGSVTVQSGGRIAPGNSPGTLTVGSLNLLSGANLNFEFGTPGVVGGGVNDLIDVTGDLTLDGSLNISALAGFGIGKYRLFNYGGTLVDNGLDFGITPGAYAYQIQTAIGGRVTLLVGSATAGSNLYWDGAGTVGDDAVSGGSGVWTSGATNWTLADGSFNYAWGGQNATFANAAGTVSVVGPVSFSGLEFQTSGYTIAGGAGGVLNPSSNAVVAVSTGVTTSIEAPLAGSGGLNLVGAGTLVLSGQNTYTGGTAIAGGSTLQIGNGGTTGSIVGNVVNHGDLVFNRADTIAFAGEVSGSGRLRQSGSGTLILTGENTYTGGTTIDRGATLQIGDGGTTGSIAGDVANDGSLVFKRADIVTFGGTVSGSGSLHQQGAGTLKLTGENTYTGGTTIATGSTLQIGAGGTAGSIIGDVANEGALVFERADGIGFGGTISGSGSLRQEGAGTLVLSGNNSYSGGTSILRGAISISKDASLGYGDLYIDNAALHTTSSFASSRRTTLGLRGGAFDVAAGTTFTSTGRIDGDGALIKRGGGTMTLIGDNAYTGGTRINAGIVSISRDANLGAASGSITLAGGTLRTTADVESSRAMVVEDVGGIETINGSTFRMQGGITGAGSLQKSGDGRLLLGGTNSYSGGTLVQAGTLQGDTRSLQGQIVNNGALVFDQAFDGVFTGTVFGTGSVIKRGSGAISLTGDHGLSGVTSIESGVLALDGTLGGSIEVGRDGVFTASGVIGGSLKVDGRLELPTGPEAGRFGVVGDATFAPGSVYGVGLNAAGESSALVAKGEISVQGMTIAVAAGGGSYARVTPYAVLLAEGGLAGMPSAMTNSPSLEALVSQNGSTVFVTLLNREVPLQQFATSANGSRIASALDRLKGTATGDLADVTRELTALDDRTLALSLDAMSGEIHASAVQLTAIDAESATDAVRSELTTRMSQRGPELNGESTWGSEGSRTWFRWRGERNSFESGLLGVRGGTGSISGFAMGRDWTRSSNWLFGVGGSFATGRMALNGLSDATSFSSPRAMAYAGYARNGWAVDGGAAVARAAYQTTRTIQFTALSPAGGRLLGGVNRTATSRPSGIASEMWTELRLDRQFGSLKLQPTAGVRHARYGLTEYAESGADALSFVAPERTISSFQADVGVRVARARGSLRPYVGGIFRRELTSGRTAVGLDLAGAPNGSFEVDGLRLPTRATIGQAGLMFRTRGAGLSLMYEARANSAQFRQTIQLGIDF